jgi:hypothetical protein
MNIDQILAPLRPCNENQSLIDKIQQMKRIKKLPIYTLKAIDTYILEQMDAEELKDMIRLLHNFSDKEEKC